MGWINSSEKRERILNAAEKCLRENGLNALNIRDIAKEAGVSLGSVHYYFSVKEHILMEIFEQFVIRVSEATLSRVQDANPRKVIIDVVDGFFAELSRDPETCHIFIDLWGHVSKYEDLRSLLNKYYSNSLEWLVNLIEKGNKQGLFKVENPALTAIQIIAIIDGLKVQVHLFESEVDLDGLKDDCKNFILHALQANDTGESE